MGVDFGYVASAKHEDLFVVNYEDDTNTYYANQGDGFFSEITTTNGLASPCFKYLGWGTFFGDFDLDTDLDVFVAQGHVVPQADDIAASPRLLATEQAVSQQRRRQVRRRQRSERCWDGG